MAICCGRQPQLGQLRVGDLDVDALLLVADEVDLVDAGNAQQLGAQTFGIVMQLRRREAIALQGVEIGVDVAEFIVEVRSLHPDGSV